MFLNFGNWSRVLVLFILLPCKKDSKGRLKSHRQHTICLNMGLTHIFRQIQNPFILLTEEIDYVRNQRKPLSSHLCTSHRWPWGIQSYSTIWPSFLSEYSGSFLLTFFIFYNEHYNLTEPHSSSCPLIAQIVYIKMTSFHVLLLTCIITSYWLKRHIKIVLICLLKDTVSGKLFWQQFVTALPHHGISDYVWPHPISGEDKGQNVFLHAD